MFYVIFYSSFSQSSNPLLSKYKEIAEYKDVNGVPGLDSSLSHLRALAKSPLRRLERSQQGLCFCWEVLLVAHTAASAGDDDRSHGASLRGLGF